MGTEDGGQHQQHPVQSLYGMRMGLIKLSTQLLANDVEGCCESRTGRQRMSEMHEVVNGGKSMYLITSPFWLL